MTFPLYVFDAYGTLFDVHSAVARHRGLVGEQAEKLSEIWRAKQLEYTWTRSLMGAWRDFDALTERRARFRRGPLRRHFDAGARKTARGLRDAGRLPRRRPRPATFARPRREMRDPVQRAAGGARARRRLGRTAGVAGPVPVRRTHRPVQNGAGGLCLGRRALWRSAGPGLFPILEPLGCRGRGAVRFPCGLDQPRRRAGRIFRSAARPCSPDACGVVNRHKKKAAGRTSGPSLGRKRPRRAAAQASLALRFINYVAMHKMSMRFFAPRHPVASVGSRTQALEIYELSARPRNLRPPRAFRIGQKNARKEAAMPPANILIALLIVCFFAVLPTWPHASRWGYFPSCWSRR